MRLLSPSTTLTLTSTVSPGPNSGISLPAESFSTCSFSSCWIMFMGMISVGSASNRRAVQNWSEWVGELVLQSFRLVTLVFWVVLGLFPGQVSRPEVRAARLSETFGLRPPPGLNLGVVAGGKLLRDGWALEQR